VLLGVRTEEGQLRCGCLHNAFSNVWFCPAQWSCIISVSQPHCCLAVTPNVLTTGVSAMTVPQSWTGDRTMLCYVRCWHCHSINQGSCSVVDSYLAVHLLWLLARTDWCSGGCYVCVLSACRVTCVGINLSGWLLFQYDFCVNQSGWLLFVFKNVHVFLCQVTYKYATFCTCQPPNPISVRCDILTCRLGTILVCRPFCMPWVK